MAITLDGTDGVTTTGLTSNGIDDNATSTAVTINSSGNVSTTERLRIGTGSSDTRITLNNEGTEQTNSSNYIRGVSGQLIYNSASGVHKWEIAGSEKMRIDSIGHVGIRTTPNAWRTTDSVLQLGNRASVTGLANDTHFSNNAYFDTGSTWKAQETAQATNYYQSAGIHAWRYAGTTTAGAAISWSEAMRIDNSGNLLVGKTAQSNSSAGFFVEPGSGGYASFVNTATGSSNRTILCNRQGGNGYVIEFRRSNNTVGSITVTTSATAYNTSSDQRLKENIVDAPSASDDIDAIQIRSYDWKADGQHQKYGVVAQELVNVAPEAVSQGETEEDTWGVDYSKLVPMLVKEIQDLRARVAQLEEA